MIIFIFRHYSNRRLQHLETFLDIKKYDNGETSVALKPQQELPKHIPLFKIIENYNTMFDYYCIYKTINVFMERIDLYNKQNNPRVFIFIYLFFCLGWAYTFIYFILHLI